MMPNDIYKILFTILVLFGIQSLSEGIAEEPSRHSGSDSAASITDLLGKTTGSGAEVKLRGFYEAGDGGGGIMFVFKQFKPDGSTYSSSDHNGISVIDPGHAPPTDPVTAGWFTPTEETETKGCWVRTATTELTPEQFGAKGDGETNDQVAFSAMESFINTQGVARIEFGAGKTYLYGDQEFTGKADGASYRPIGLMEIRNCKYVELRGNGATLRLDPDGLHGDGFRAGSFHPETGKAADGPTTDPDRQAGVAELVFRDVAKLEIKNLTIDGSNEDIQYGGEWGDVGYQVPGNNLVIRGRTQCMLENVHTHHAVKDGLYIDTDIPGQPINGEDDPDTSRLANIHVRNVRSEYNGRQGLSYTGGIGGVIENSDFNHTGRGGVASSPGAGVDIEHGPIHQLNFINCRFINNSGAGIVHDGSKHTQVTLSGCIILASDSWALWNKEPSWVFRNCKIYGPSPYAAGTFYACRFQDKTYGNGDEKKPILLNDVRNGTFVDCTFRADRYSLGWFSNGANCTFVRSNFIIGNDGSRTPGERIGVFRGVRLYDSKFTDDLDEPPREAYQIITSDSLKLRNSRVNTQAINLND